MSCLLLTELLGKISWVWREMLNGFLYRDDWADTLVRMLAVVPAISC